MCLGVMGFIRRSGDTASKNHRLYNNKYYDLIILIYLVYGENTNNNKTCPFITYLEPKSSCQKRQYQNCLSFNSLFQFIIAALKSQ